MVMLPTITYDRTSGVTYPGIAPRPILSIVPHTVPLCDSGSERSNLEQGRILNFVKTYSLNKLNTFHKVGARTGAVRSSLVRMIE